MHILREQAKRYLIRSNSHCALCGAYGTDLHEVICPLRRKYSPGLDEEPLARLVYLPQNCVILCNQCNVIDANSRRDYLMGYNMELYGVDAVVGVYRSMAKLLKAPTAYIPMSITFHDKEVRIL